MRSVTFTLLLLVLAAAVTLLAALRLKDGNLEKLFGTPPVQIGKHLYKFDPIKTRIRRIQLGGNGFLVDCRFKDGTWTAECSRVTRGDATKGGDDKTVTEVLWKDRMDKRVADLIVQFTLGTEVVDVIPKGKLDTAKAGLKEGIIGVKIEDEKGELLAKYFLGHPTKWVYIDPTQPKPKPGERWIEDKTVFIQPVDPGRNDETWYAGTGDIHSLFRDGFRHLRDHHPFYINPLGLESVRIQNGEDELVLSHTAPEAPWRITKPLERKSNSAAVAKLLSDLFNLRAVQVKDRSEVTLPEEKANGRQKFALKHFGQPSETVLTIMPPATPEAETVYATVSDRPGTVFELRLKPLPSLPATPKTPGVPAAVSPPKDDLVSLAEIPDTINELRDPMLTMLNAEQLQGILIKPSTGPEILLARERVGADWLYGDTRDGPRQKANPFTLARLVAAITTSKVGGFETDSATNLAPYGLDRPAISLTFVSFGSDRFELLFGQSNDGSWYAMRVGTPSVMNVDDALIDEISTRLWQWRLPHPWSIVDVDVRGIERTMSGKPKLTLEYSMVRQIWAARENLVDRSTQLVTARADKLLGALLQMQVDEWLAPEDPKALEALANPTLRFEITADEHDENTGALKGVAHRVMVLGPGSGPVGGEFYYGRVDQDPNPFRISAKYVERLQVDLFSDN